MRKTLDIKFKEFYEKNKYLIDYTNNINNDEYKLASIKAKSDYKNAVIRLIVFLVFIVILGFTGVFNFLFSTCSYLATLLSNQFIAADFASYNASLNSFYIMFLLVVILIGILILILYFMICSIKKHYQLTLLFDRELVTKLEMDSIIEPKNVAINDDVVLHDEHIKKLKDFDTKAIPVVDRSFNEIADEFMYNFNKYKDKLSVDELDDILIRLFEIYPSDFIKQAEYQLSLIRKYYHDNLNKSLKRNEIRDSLLTVLNHLNAIITHTDNVKNE